MDSRIMRFLNACIDFKEFKKKRNKSLPLLNTTPSETKTPEFILTYEHGYGIVHEKTIILDDDDLEYFKKKYIKSFKKEKLSEIKKLTAKYDKMIEQL